MHSSYSDSALYDIDAALQEHARRGYLSQLLFQERDAVQLRGLTERVNNLFAVLMVIMIEPCILSAKLTYYSRIGSRAGLQH